MCRSEYTLESAYWLSASFLYAIRTRKLVRASVEGLYFYLHTARVIRMPVHIVRIQCLCKSRHLMVCLISTHVLDQKDDDSTVVIFWISSCHGHHLVAPIHQSIAKSLPRHTCPSESNSGRVGEAKSQIISSKHFACEFLRFLSIIQTRCWLKWSWSIAEDSGRLVAQKGLTSR